MFAAHTYISRRKKLMEIVNEGIIFLPGNNDSPRNYEDNTFTFRQDSSFLYYFGIDIPGVAAILDIDNQKETFFGNDFTIDEIVWRGPQPTIQEYASKSGIEKTDAINRISAYIDDAIKRGRKIHFLPPYRADNRILLCELLNCSVKQLNEKASVPLIKAVVSQREIKTDEEIVQLTEAVNISVDMHIAAIQTIRPGIMESEVAAKIHEVALASGGDIGFPIIATKNGQTLHNHFHGNKLEKGDLFLVDAGAENAMHYNGDLSSTIPVSRNLSTMQKEIYDITLLAHNAAIDALKPGTPFQDVHFTACRSIINSFKDIGLMKGDTEDALANGAHALFFPCGTGHMLGLDVHDMEDLGEQWVGYGGRPKSTQFGLKSLRLAKKLEPGHVLTIEPGIYFIPELIQQWKSQNHLSQYLNWDKIAKYSCMGGYRNEEDFLITNKGFQLLGKPKPKTIEEIELVRS